MKHIKLYENFVTEAKLTKEIKELEKLLKSIKSNTPAAQGRKASIQDDIERLKNESVVTEAFKSSYVTKQGSGYAVARFLDKPTSQRAIDSLVKDLRKKQKEVLGKDPGGGFSMDLDTIYSGSFSKEEAEELLKSLNESVVNEAVKISVDMPASMKKWIMGEVKSHPNTWSNELTDLTNTIVSLHRELDLDLLKSDKGPEQVDVRNTPVDELTTRCIETINAIWPKMGEWAKEDIYTDYENWFKVGKKDREHYGEK